MMPAYLQVHLLPGRHLTGWDPGWYDGYPIYTFYFVLPDLLAALASLRHPLQHRLQADDRPRLGRSCRSPPGPAAGSSGCARRSRPRWPRPPCPFLFDYTWTIYGGNLFSTLAGEYAYSLASPLALVFLGLFARGLRTGTAPGPGRRSSWPLCILAHIVPAMFALAGAAVVLTASSCSRRASRCGRRPGPAGARPWPASGPSRSAAAVARVVGGLDGRARGAALGVVARALRPPTSPTRPRWATRTSPPSRTSSSPGPTCGRSAWPGWRWWSACGPRSRFGLLFAVLGGLSALASSLDPQGSLYNVRLLPLWFLCVYLLAGWAFGRAVHRPSPAAGATWPDAVGRAVRTLARGRRRPPAPAPAPPGWGRRRRWPGPARPARRSPLVVVPALRAPGAPRSRCIRRRQPGQQLGAPGTTPATRGRPPTPSTRALMTTMTSVGRRTLRVRPGHVGVQRRREPLRHPRGAHAPALLDRRLHRLDGGPPLRVLDHHPVPLLEPGRALGRARRTRGRPALRPARRPPRGRAPPAARRAVLHGLQPPVVETAALADPDLQLVATDRPVALRLRQPDRSTPPGTSSMVQGLRAW